MEISNFRNITWTSSVVVMKNICLSECGRNYRELQKSLVLTKDFSQSPSQDLNGTCQTQVRSITTSANLLRRRADFPWQVQSTWTCRGSVEMLVRGTNILLTVLKWAEGLTLYSWFLFTFRNRRYSKSSTLHFCEDHLKWQKITKY